MNFRGGGLNIHFGDTAPEDTTKLWVKSTETSDIIINPTIPEPDVYETLNPGSIPNSSASVKLQSYSAAIVGTNIYIFGGTYNPNSSTVRKSSSIYKFNISSNKFTTVSTSLPVALYQLMASAVGTDIYIFGGYDDEGGCSRAIYKFDTNTDTISTLTLTLPAELVDASTCAIGNNIYIIGGRYSSGYTSSSIYKFDTISETIQKYLYLPYTAMYIGVATVGTDIYTFSGTTINSSGYKYPDYMCKIDTVNDSVTTLSRTLNLSGSGVSSIGSDIYLLGGKNNSKASNVIYRYDTINDTMTTLSSTSSVGGSCPGKAFTVGSSIYHLPTNLTTVFKFRDMKLNNTELLIIPNTQSNLWNAISDDIRMNIGISEVYAGNGYDIGKPVEAYLYQNEAWTLI